MVCETGYEKMKIRPFLFFGLVFLVATHLSCASGPPSRKTGQAPKKYQVILVHDLLNKYPWGESFLEVILDIWGSSNVYVVYLGEPARIWKRKINGQTIHCYGENDQTAGTAFVEKQAEYLHRAVTKFQAKSGLDLNFSIIAHGMGGLVSRCYIYRHPQTVTDLVTIGTPHHGSPLAESMSWSGLYFGPHQVVENLKPTYAEQFNRRYPVQGAPLAGEGKIYTIRGDADGWDSFGRGGELQLGWDILRIDDWTDSDGMVPENASVIDGAVHIADFSGHDHYDLIMASEVAQKAAEYLR
jgi:triacylglycerol esterase/lipase EstA (alpha/beta hydrolase family)